MQYKKRRNRTHNHLRVKSLTMSIFKFVVFATLVFGIDGLYTFEAFASMWQRNVDATKAFACENPQPRAYKAAELLKGIAKSDTVIPHAAVLHRCDRSSGCCALAHEQCRPVVEHAVDLVFLIQSAKMNVFHRTYAGRNHTKCACGAAGDSTTHSNVVATNATDRII